MAYHTKSIIAFVLVLTFSSANANAPEQCPKVDVLKQHSFTQAYYSPDTGFYQPYMIDNYQTPDSWLFAVFVDKEKSKEKALALANRYLSTLYGNAEPAPDGHGGYTCFYMTDYGFAFAINPPIIDNMTDRGADGNNLD